MHCYRYRQLWLFAWTLLAYDLQLVTLDLRTKWEAVLPVSLGEHTQLRIARQQAWRSACLLAVAFLHPLLFGAPTCVDAVGQSPSLAAFEAEEHPNRSTLAAIVGMQGQQVSWYLGQQAMCQSFSV